MLHFLSGGNLSVVGVGGGHFTEVQVSKKHPGFRKVQDQIARKQGISQERAGAILASSSRKASAKAKRKNPRLKRVKGRGHSRDR